MSFVQKAVDRLKKQPEKASEPISTLGQPVEEAEARGSIPAEAVEEAAAGPRLQVDAERLRREGFLAPIAYERRLAEEYRHIKRPILANAFGLGAGRVPDGVLVMVASAFSGEGKTRTCINLALSMAQERDRSVVLVDGDVAKPTVTNLFGLGEHMGLLDLAAGDCSGLSEVLVTTDIPRLLILPAGKPRENATELLASQRMKSVVSQLTESHPDRVVLFDSPPLLATTESLILAGIAGQIAIVVAAGSTAREAVREAIELLDPEKAINVILNKSHRRGGGDGYGYGYGYGAYGYHGDKASEDAKPG